MKLTIRLWKNDTLSIRPKNTGEKRKDQENIIVITITIIIMTITMTMIMTEIVGPDTGINHTTEIDHIVEIYHETTMKMITEITIKMIIGMIIEMIIEITIKMITEMTIKMTIEMTTEMTVEKKIIGISKNRNIRESIEINMKTHMKTGTTRIIIEKVTKKDRNKSKDQHRDDSYDQIRSSSKEKECSYDDRKDDSFETKLKRVHKILQTMSKEKEIAIALMLVDSEN